MSGPLVTIAIPTYNRADGYLLEALGSAMAQTYEPLEILVLDNASVDSTAERVRQMADHRVRYVCHETNIGPKANINACLELARGTYFLLLHDDDRIDPDHVRSCMAALEVATKPEPPGLIRTGIRVIDAEGTELSERRNLADSASVADLMRSWFEQRTSIYLPSTLFHTETLREVGGFDTPFWLYSDTVAMIRVAARRWVLDVPDVLASFRRHGAHLGGSSAIDAWVADSRFLIDVLCEAAPEDAESLRERALRYFTLNNYDRVRRMPRLLDRLRGYRLVYRSFGYRYSPVFYVAMYHAREWRAFLRQRLGAV